MTPDLPETKFHVLDSAMDWCKRVNGDGNRLD